jgi:hypothetical protein
VFISPLHRNGSFCIAARVYFRGKLFTESLPSNKRLLWLHYSGFQAFQALKTSTLITTFYSNMWPGVQALGCNWIAGTFISSQERQAGSVTLEEIIINSK